jgi:flagellar assembly protein FliH
VLATPTVVGQTFATPSVRSIDSVQASSSPADGQRVAPVDPAAVRRTIEEQVRRELEEQMLRSLDAQRDDAHKEGLAKGLAEGREAAEKDARRLESERRGQTQKLLAALEQAHEVATGKWQADIGTLAFEAVCRVVADQSASRDFVLGIVEAVCREAKAQSKVSARLHPRDLRLLAGDAASLSLPAGTCVHLVADETLTLGGCVVDTDAGRFDGSLDTQLRRLHVLMCGGAGGITRD